MGSNNRSLSESHIIEFVEAFNKFDEGQTGLVSTKQLGNLLRHLGMNPTKEELQDLTIQIDPHVTGYLKLPDLLDMMSRIIMERNYDAQIEDAFRCFDRKGQGTITRQDFEILFENLGEKLTEEEKSGLLDEADSDQEGFISYAEFCSIKYLL